MKSLFISSIISGAVLMIGAAVAFAVNNGQSQDSGSDGPSLSAQATKAAEAGRPTPTAIPAVAGCPVVSDLCDFGKEVASVLREGSSAALFAVSRATTLRCEEQQVVATRPLCDRGGTQTGYLTSGFTTFNFRGGDDFANFVMGQLGGGPNPSVSLVAVGCPGESAQQMNCAELALLTVAPVNSNREVERGNFAPIVLIAQRDTSGRFHLAGAQSSFDGHPSNRGGNYNFAQYGMSFRGTVWFVPVNLP